MWKKILHWLGLMTWMDHLKEVNELEDAAVRERRDKEEQLRDFPYKMDKIISIYSKEALTAMYYKLVNVARNKHPELIKQWAGRLKDASKNPKKESKE